MNKSDKSYIDPELVKTEDQGKGIYYASLGKEIDEHDAIGKITNAKAFTIRSFGLFPFIVAAMFLIGIISMFTFFFLMGGSTSKSVKYENGMTKRIVTTDNSIEYQIKDSDGEWYKVDKDVYNSLYDNNIYNYRPNVY